MVWSLVYSSLVSIANGVKDGTIQNPHMLPPNLRQRVLNTVLQRRLINEPKCTALLSSVKFLNGMELLSTEHGGYEMEFLERLETSMATMLPNGETVGDAITKLNLSVYGCEIRRGSRVVKGSNYPMVARLIAQCPNTTSLALCGIQSRLALTGQDYPGSGTISPWFPSVLNKDDVCNSVMENLIDLSLSDLENVLSSDWPMINFKQLTTLKLDNCCVQVDIWPEFLQSIPTLENLHMIDVFGVGKGDDSFFPPDHVDDGLDWILPFPMPHLQSLEIIGFEHQFYFDCNKAFVDNLIGCPEIRRVHLMLDQNSTDEESMERLANMNIDLKVKARFSDWNANIPVLRRYKIDAALDSSSNFKIVRIFHERMYSFELYVWLKWFPEYTTALENAIDSCSNLTKFCLQIPEKSRLPSRLSDVTEIKPDEMLRINAILVQFFGTRERAMQLKFLRLDGNFEEAVMLALFEYGLNLDRLEIWGCQAVRDQHLIDLVSNGGGKLKHLNVSFCQNVTSEGIIPILVKSADGLLWICVFPSLGDDEGRNWETMVSNLCPYAKISD